MQDSFNFSVPPVDPQQEPAAPIAPSASPIAKHCSSMGAQKAEMFRGSMWSRMLAFYRALGPCSDVDMAAYLTLPEDQTRPIHPSTVSARRREMIQQGLVLPHPVGVRKNERTGVSNSLWGLTEKGRQR